MQLIITLLTIVLVLDCLFLGLLILMQLPKKEAGLGQAFGGSATDALFGAGSGNVLTKATKYAAGVFFALALILSILTSHANEDRRRQRSFEDALAKQPGKTQTPPKAPAVAPSSNVLSTTTATNLSLTLSTNAPAPAPAPAPVTSPAATNAPASSNK